MARPRREFARLAGEEVPIVWNGRRARATVPALLAERDLALDAATATRIGAATAEITRAAESLVVDLEPLARLLLRSEGVASSFIEGITAPVVDVVLAEEHLPAGTDAASWVAASLATTATAIDHAESDAPLDVGTLCSWHRQLMTGSPTPARFVGRIREEQGWIGGTSPLDAHLVTPPSDRLPALLADLLAWLNRVDLDPIPQAAVAHAQFEIVHPFGDGNGRIGRVLVAWVLVRRLALVVPPPVSVAVAADVGGYAAGLVRFRLSDHLGWIRWFADAVASGGVAQRELIAEVEVIRARWRNRLSSAGVRRDAAAHRVLDLLPRHLVLTSALVVDELDVTHKAALTTLARLADLGILTEHGAVSTTGRGRPARLYVATELLGLAGASPLRH
jgi:Fic family protein